MKSIFTAMSTQQQSEEIIRVLLVDDQAIVAEAIRRMLDPELGIEFFYCPDPMQALKMAAEVRPTVILQDLVMPDIEGLQLLRFFRVNPVTKNIPIIVLSSKEDPIIKSNAFEAQASDYLVKIPDKIELVARIRAHSRSYIAQLNLSKTLQELGETRIELERKNSELLKLTNLDGLTEICNRRRFNEYLDQEWARSARTRNSLALIMIDIDHFKAYNDHYGHQGGDDVLRLVAATLENGVHRPGDLVARYGGEEFAMILPETDIQGARLVAEAIRSSIEALSIVHSYSPIADHVTISIGVACMVPMEGGAPGDLIAMADKALYSSKEQGRNRYTLYDTAMQNKAEMSVVKTKQAQKVKKTAKPKRR